MYGTFSGFGGIGGFASGNADLISYLRSSANSYAFSCALPPGVVAGLLAALDVSPRSGPAHSAAGELDYFRDQLAAWAWTPRPSTSQVIPLMLGGDRSLLYDFCAEFRKRGLFLAAVDYSGAPENELRLRAAITAAHTLAASHER